MNKIQVEEKYELDMPLSDKPLIQQDYYYVMVSHRELDDLIARLMHLAELDSDKEHRTAVKGELKYRVRNWLDQLYENSGYKNHKLVEGARVLNVDAAFKNEADLQMKARINS